MVVMNFKHYDNRFFLFLRAHHYLLDIMIFHEDLSAHVNISL